MSGQIQQIEIPEIPVYVDEQVAQINDPAAEILKVDLPDTNFHPIELYWENITVSAKIKEKKGPCKSRKYIKTILDKVKGKASPGTFSAILGPSGCGKTTLLNLLSGRLFSSNLETSGCLKINGNEKTSVECISNQMAYVMQDDILFATFTPREAFSFSARLRLGLTGEKLQKKVDFFLQLLGLNLCADTKVGNALIRGVSGGERKRTSIGVELLTNPSVIFLDEPTTGLDSASALNIIAILKALSKRGRTVVSTVHQPSSEIYENFDKLLLMVKGQIIYQGSATDALTYFDEKFKLKSPEFCNPSTFLMKCMNPEGLLVEKMQQTRNFNIKFDENVHLQFKERLDFMVNTYSSSPQYTGLIPTLNEPIPEDKTINQSSWLIEFNAILIRAFKNEARNPMEVKAKVGVTFIFVAVILIVFSGLGNFRQGIQNRTGILFFLTMNHTFGSVMGCLLTISAEKPVFLRERMNKTYRTSTYFLGRTLSDLPVQFFLPTVTVAIVYYALGLNDSHPWKILLLILIQNGVYFHGVSIGYIMSIVFPNAEMAINLVPVIIIPLIVFAGFFVNQNNIPYYFYPIQYLSMLKYGFQASVMNEFEDINYYCAPNVICHPLQEFDFQENLTDSIIILWAIGIAFRIIAFILLDKVSTPKIQKINSVSVNQGRKVIPISSTK